MCVCVGGGVKQLLYRPEVSRSLSLPYFKDGRDMNVVRLSAHCTVRFYLPGNILLHIPVRSRVYPRAIDGQMNYIDEKFWCHPQESNL